MPEFPKKQGSTWTHRFAVYKEGKRIAYPQKSGFRTKTSVLAFQESTI